MTHRHQIIGLSGYAGSGKDTAALGLITDGWERRSFADVLRAFCYAQNPLVKRADEAFMGGYEYLPLRELVDEAGWERAKVENPEVRELLQRTGTEAGRDVLGANVWVDAVMNNLPDAPVVVTDVRFGNEYAAIKAAGGHVVRIERPGIGPVNAHESDRALDGFQFDRTIRNDDDQFMLGMVMRGVAADLARTSPPSP